MSTNLKTFAKVKFVDGLNQQLEETFAAFLGLLGLYFEEFKGSKDTSVSKTDGETTTLYMNLAAFEDTYMYIVQLNQKVDVVNNGWSIHTVFEGKDTKHYAIVYGVKQSDTGWIYRIKLDKNFQSTQFNEFSSPQVLDKGAWVQFLNNLKPDGDVPENVSKKVETLNKRTATGKEDELQKLLDEYTEQPKEDQKTKESFTTKAISLLSQGFSSAWFYLRQASDIVGA